MQVSAYAGDLDIHLNQLGTPIKNADGTLSYPSSLNRDYRALMSEVAFMFAPKMLAPAETTGLSGFDMGAVVSFMTIQANASHWNAAAVVMNQNKRPNALAPMVGFHIRKGLPFSIELAAQFNYLPHSSMFSLGGSVRYGILEGYKWAPDISLHLSVGRLIGASDFDMTTLDAGATIGKTFAIKGMTQLSIYAGFGAMSYDASFDVLDKTPNNNKDNQAVSVGGSLYSIKAIPMSETDNLHWRTHAGAKFKSHVFSLLYQIDLGIMKNTPILLTHSIKIGFDF